MWARSLGWAKSLLHCFSGTKEIYNCPKRAGGNSSTKGEKLIHYKPIRSFVRLHEYKCHLYQRNLKPSHPYLLTAIKFSNVQEFYEGLYSSLRSLCSPPRNLLLMQSLFILLLTVFLLLAVQYLQLLCFKVSVPTLLVPLSRQNLLMHSCIWALPSVLLNSFTLTWEFFCFQPCVFLKAPRPESHCVTPMPQRELCSCLRPLTCQLVCLASKLFMTLPV